jgi:uncharacterized protein YjiS (DUF1127 family)
MNPRDTQEQIGLFSATLQAPTAGTIDAIVTQARRERDAALAQRVQRFFGALAAIGQALLTWNARSTTYENLRSLSDRELADIGLTRGDIGRVFEPGFALPQRPANTNAPATARPAAA